MATATVASFQTLMASARDAVASGDLATAKTKLTQASIDLNALEVSAGRGGANYTLRQSLNDVWGQILSLEDEQNKAVDSGRRLIRTRVNFGS